MQSVLDEEAAATAARTFKALSDPVRLRLLSLIAACGDDNPCVCDLLCNFELSPPTISHHLKVLRLAGLIDCERRGTWVYYRVDRSALNRAGALLMQPSATTAQR